MSGETVQAKYEELDTIARRFGQRAQANLELQRRIQRNVQALRNGGWQGRGSAAFFSEMDGKIFPGLKRLGEALEKAQGTTLEIKAIIQQAEEEAARVFMGQRGLMPVPTSTPAGMGNGALAASPAAPNAFYIQDLNQADLSVFFSQYEDSDHISKEILEKYLTNPELMKHQRAVTQALVDRVQKGEAPLTPDQFYQLALRETGDPGTALLMAHNITKALARGRSPIGWEKISDSPLKYRLDGQELTFDPTKFHAQAQATDARGRPSIFYAVFSANALGKQDPGDWYHYYLNAATTYSAAKGELKFNDPGWNPLGYAYRVDDAVDDAMGQMARSGQETANQGWRYANALSYLEGAKYGTDYQGTQVEVLRESNLHREGALYGLRLAGIEPDPSWRWYVPKAGSASGRFDTSVDLSEDSQAILSPSGAVQWQSGSGPNPLGDEGSSR